MAKVSSLTREAFIFDMISMLSRSGQQRHIRKSSEVIVAAGDVAVKDQQNVKFST